MKLILILDEGEINSFKLNYNSLSTELNFEIILSPVSDIDNLSELINYHNPFFILSYLKADFKSSYIENENLVNSVNNYHLSDSTDNIVNINNSYFNVFVDITKSISINKKTNHNLKRVDLIHPFNYNIAKICTVKHKQYYTLNYKNFDYKIISDILKLIR